MDNLALCELLSGDVASLVEVNFGSKSYVSCSYCSYFVLVDLGLVMFRSKFSCCCACVDHLQVAPRHKAELLIQIGFCISASNLYFCQIHLLLEVPVQCRKLHCVGSSDPSDRFEEFFSFASSPIHPPLGITKILSNILLNNQILLINYHACV